MHNPCLNIAYLTAEYPKVSHTFIRREILELERRGHNVIRLAIRNAGDAIADESDRIENERTVHFMSLSKWSIVSNTIKTIITRPIRWLSTLLIAIKMSRTSDRGLLRHLAYLLEASVLRQILVAKKVEHLHVHFGTNAAAVARLIHHLGGPRYSMTVHGSAEFDAPLGFSLREKVEDAVFVAAVSSFCYAQLCRWVPPNQWSKIHIVRCSVDENYFASECPVDESSRVLLSIGRLCVEKGYLLLLDAIKQLVTDGMDLRLVMVGDGELRSLIEDRIRELGLSHHVQITGWLDEAEIRAKLRQCRVLVQPSFAEGLPVVIMEAFALARPVISTHVGGIPELVRQDENGWLVPAGSVEELAAAIQNAMESPIDKLRRMGEFGRELTRSKHHVTKEAAVIESLFIAAVANKGTS